MEIIKDYFIICENAILDDKNKVSLISLFDNILVKSVPGGFSRIVFVGSFVIVKDDSTPEYLDYEVKIKNPLGSYVGVNYDKGKTKIDTRKSKGKKTGIIFTLNNLLLQEYGMYTAELYIDANLIATQTFEVIKDTSL